MNYLEEEEIFNEESRLERMWGIPVVLIYWNCVIVNPQSNFCSYYIPFYHKGKKVSFDRSLFY